MSTTDPYLTDKQVAAELCISRAGVWRLVEAKDLTVVRVGKRTARFPMSEVNRYKANLLELARKEQSRP